MGSKHTEQDAIAVVGASALYPGAEDGQRFWHNIMAGGDFITDVPAGHWLIEDYYDPEPGKAGKIYGRRGGFLPDTPFDPLQYGLPPNQLSSTDTAQLLGLIVAEKVLADAVSFQFEKVNRRDVSVILGVASATELVVQMAGRIQRPNWIKALREAGLPESQVEDICDRIEATYPEWNESTFPGLLGNVVAGRIANRLNLGGTNCVIDAACASSLGAVAMAVQELQLGHSDLVITGGADTLNDIFMYMCFSQTPALSPTGDCRPFSDSADGTLLGEGIGMVALRRLDDAERDGDHIYGVIRGIGSSSDGRAKSIYAPRAEGQEIALRRAYERAGYDPGEVELVEAHGTATKAGDAAEFEGLCRAFGATEREDSQWCALGSIKSQIGHTKAAAGAASLFKVIMALHHKVLPPTIKVDRPNSRLDFAASPFYLNTRARPWIRPTGKTRKGAVSSFGFGGSNFHMTLEEYAGPAQPAPRFVSLPEHLVLLATAEVAGLQSAIEGLQERLAQGATLAALARASQMDFSPDSACRLALIAADQEALNGLADTVKRHLTERPETALSLPGRVHYLPETAEIAKGGIAFLFPGQGSQYLDMGAGAAMTWSSARAVWDDNAVLWQDTDPALHEVVFPRPAFSDEERDAQTARLTRTDWAQPAIGTVSLSLLALLGQAGVRPDAVGGHSYGEITALHAAGAIPLARDMLRISRRRGELMRDADGEPGAMLAIQAGEERVRELLAQAEGTALTLANINGPQQTVVAGERLAIDAFANRLQTEAIRCRPLPVATAFHTEHVAGCAEPLADFLRQVKLTAPEIPVYGNTYASPYADDPEHIRLQLAEQLARPVQFSRMLESMYEAGCRTFLEVGPGTTLTGMVRDCFEGRPHLAVATNHRQRDDRTSLLDALAQLSALGIAVDYDALWSEFAPPPDAEAPSKPSAATVYLNGSNPGKPYPPAAGAAARPAPNPEPTQEVPPMTASRQASDSASAPAPQAPVEPPVQPTGHAAAPPPAPPSAEWAASFAEIQRQALEAQQAYTQALSESHQAFLRATETAFTQLGQLGGAGNGQPPSAPPAPQPRQAAPPAPASPRSTVSAAPTAISAAPPTAEPRPATAAPPATQPAAAPPAAPSPAAPPPAATTDPEALLYEVVAEKTGYPTEMLELDMELEAGLGIDSIKRVEILSVLQEKVPALASIDPAELARLNTLGEIVEFARRTVSDTPSATDSAGPADTPAPTAPASAAEQPTPAATTDHEALLYEVVAEKTGYPTEMLTLDMELEAGLGIDSIKRVEILSVLQEKVPQLASVDPAELARLNTLGDIVGFARDMTGEEAGTAKKPEPGAGMPDRSLTRRVVELQARPAPGFMTPGLMEAAPLFIVAPADRMMLAETLADRLEATGIRAKAVGQVPKEAEALLLLSGLDIADIDDAVARNEQLFAQLRQCADRMAESGRLLVTVQDTGGDFGILGRGGAEVWATGLGAAAKTAAQEWPRVDVKAIDIAARAMAPEELANRLVQELLTGGSEREVGLTVNERRVPALGTTADETPVPAAFESEDVIVVSGGARGVTTACLEALMQRTPARLALLGRTQPQPEAEDLRGLTTDAELKRHLLQASRLRGETLTPAELGREVGRILAQRELQANLERLRATGAEVHYFPVEIGDAGQVQRTLERIRADLGPVRGLIHAAGVLADKPIAAKSDAQFRHVFLTKVEGLRHLLAATSQDPLHHLVCFSSVAARTGNAGQIDYAMANEVLNRVCRQEARRRGQACRVKVIGWGPWAGGMVDASLQKHFTRRGVSLIGVEEGARHFAEELTGQHGAAVETLFGGELDSFAAGSADTAAEGTTRRYPVWFRHDLNPWLASHVIAGQVVVPVVTVINLACEAARLAFPGRPVTGCRDLQVRQGIRLQQFHSHGECFQLECRADPATSSVAVRLLDPDTDSEHYRLTVEIGGPSPMAPPSSREGLPPWEPASGRIYDGRLFHGPALQTIQALDGLSAQGGSGVLEHRTDECRGYAAPLDVLDGGLQLALLWVHEQRGIESLPTGIDTFRFQPDWPQRDAIHCTVRCIDEQRLKSTWQLHFFDTRQRLLGSIEGLHLHHLPTAPSQTQPADEDGRA